MKNQFVIVLAVLLFSTACARIETVMPASAPLQQITQPTPPVPTGEVKEFVVDARQWLFDPATIEVNRGDRVRLRITSADVPHGFGISEYGINQELPPGQEVLVEFVADKAGEFPFFCTVFCGQGHSNMRGLLIVR